MADVKWIKLATGLPDNKKIKQIRRLPDGDTIALMWIFLMCLAGETNDEGMVYFTPEIPFTEEMLADQFLIDINTIRLGLTTFQRFGMIEIVDNIICLSQWAKWQAVDGLAAIREQTRKRVAKHREKQKLSAGNVTRNVTVTQSNATDIEEDKEEEREVKSTTASADTVCSTDVQRIIDSWNTLGLSRVTAVKPNTTRSKTLKARIREYGVGTIMQAIEKVRASSYLKGGSKSGWTITFDWFILPNNFPKVLDGNYDNRQPVQQTYQRSAGSPMANIRREDYEKDEDVPW